MKKFTGKKRQNEYVSCKHKCIQINSRYAG